jgi:hypothetical protein
VIDIDKGAGDAVGALAIQSSAAEAHAHLTALQKREEHIQLYHQAAPDASATWLVAALVNVRGL